MRKNSIPGVKVVRAKQAGGSTAAYFYHRATGRRLQGEPGSPEFQQALEEADRQAEADQAPAAAVLTISDLVHAYQAAPAWTSLKPSTRETNQFHVAAILRAFGDMTLAEVAHEPARAAFLGWHAERAAEHPRDADARLSCLSRIIAFAVTVGLLDRHPLPRFERAYTLKPPAAAPLPASLRPGEVAVILAPRLLSKALAASYCDVTPARFDRWRKDGMMPDPLPGTARWDRVDIDAAIENLKKLGKLTALANPAPPPVEEDPLAAWLAKKGPKPWKA
ncbi:helix-turn-helix transcriptional regulator [Methylorubrum populi]